MRRICALTIAAAMILMPVSAMAADPITNYDQTIHVQTWFNAYGIAVRSTTTTTTTTTTTRTDEETGEVSTSTTITTTTVHSSWHGGSLKADTAHTNSRTDSSDGSWSESSYTDTYSYDANGKLHGCSGGGTTTSYDGETGHTTSGTITRDFIIRDGQALPTSTTTSGYIYDKDGGRIGTFTNSTTIAEGDYAYLGGSWVPMKEVSTSTTTWDAGGYETITRVTTYTRNDQGVIIGMSRTASGYRVVVTGECGVDAEGNVVAGIEDPETGEIVYYYEDGTVYEGDVTELEGEQATLRFEMQNYTATASFDSQMGWYISSEDFWWILTDADFPVPEIVISDSDGDGIGDGDGDGNA